MKHLAAAAAFALSVGLGAGAQAAHVVFAGFGGDLGKNESFSSAGGPVIATAINTEENGGDAPSLHQNLLGLGVFTGGRDNNEIDNRGDDEAIVLDFGRIVAVDGLRVGEAFLDDDFDVYGANDGAVTAITSGGLGAIAAISDLIATGSGDLDTLVNVDLMGAAYRYIVIAAPGTMGLFADDFRIKAAYFSEVPIPGALPLMASALAGFGFAARKRRQA